MKVRQVSDHCKERDCPTVYITDRGTVVFQGDPVDGADGMRLGPGEQAVELPLDVVISALRTLLREVS
ncbi:hypothetical protein EV191_108221 [Tamaricihabitans halophyticus]|uniref:Uncharacterized protein n=1 Tax=Tamaricihabitans halophyticus TaxID=1262583 RepID=A0A4R2QKZ2_9PSEU|nr:hypothetical protein EV191_108221 [Tamaricihabitans halophyticus]